jgi:hypothetical protein
MFYPAALLVVPFVVVLPALAQRIPRTWNEADLSSGLLRPPVAGATVKPVGAEYYYRMRERVMFRRYTVYTSKSEPAGYLRETRISGARSCF